MLVVYICQAVSSSFVQLQACLLYVHLRQAIQESITQKFPSKHHDNFPIYHAKMEYDMRQVLSRTWRNAVKCEFNLIVSHMIVSIPHFNRFISNRTTFHLPYEAHLWGIHISYSQTYALTVECNQRNIHYSIDSPDKDTIWRYSVTFGTFRVLSSLDINYDSQTTVQESKGIIHPKLHHFPSSYLFKVVWLIISLYYTMY